MCLTLLVINQKSVQVEVTEYLAWGIIKEIRIPKEWNIVWLSYFDKCKVTKGKYEMIYVAYALTVKKKMHTNVNRGYLGQ